MPLVSHEIVSAFIKMQQNVVSRRIQRQSYSPSKSSSSHNNFIHLPSPSFLLCAVPARTVFVAKRTPRKLPPTLLSRLQASRSPRAGRTGKVAKKREMQDAGARFLK